MTAEVTTERKPSLLEIEQSLAMLMQDLDEVTDPEERKPLEAALAEYVAKEVGKVDRIRSYIRFCEMKVTAAKQAATEATSYAQIWQNRIERVKAAAMTAMQMTGQKRLEGTVGTLAIRKNGGVQPLHITDPAMLPDECCRLEGWIGLDAWRALLTAAGTYAVHAPGLKRVPDNGAIRAKLAEDCPACSGIGELAISGACATCGGSGKNAVPGAHLGERGESLVVR